MCGSLPLAACMLLAEFWLGVGGGALAMCDACGHTAALAGITSHVGREPATRGEMPRSLVLSRLALP